MLVAVDKECHRCGMERTEVRAVRSNFKDLVGMPMPESPARL